MQSFKVSADNTIGRKAASAHEYSYLLFEGAALRHPPDCHALLHLRHYWDAGEFPLHPLRPTGHSVFISILKGFRQHGV